MPKRKGQLVDACASKHLKMAEPEVAFDHAEQKEAIHSYAQEWVQALHRDDNMSFMTFVRQLKFQITEASHIIGKNIRIGEETFCGWKDTFLSNVTTHFWIPCKASAAEVVHYGMMKN